jgi:hypothetical protein
MNGDASRLGECTYHFCVTDRHESEPPLMTAN